MEDELIYNEHNDKNANNNNSPDFIIDGLHNVRKEYYDRLQEITDIRKKLEEQLKQTHDYRKKWYEIEQLKLLKDYLEQEMKCLEKIENSYKNETDIRSKLKDMIKEEINENVSYNLIRDIADRLRL